MRRTLLSRMTRKKQAVIDTPTSSPGQEPDLEDDSWMRLRTAPEPVPMQAPVPQQVLPAFSPENTNDKAGDSSGTCSIRASSPPPKGVSMRSSTAAASMAAFVPAQPLPPPSPSPSPPLGSRKHQKLANELPPRPLPRKSSSVTKQRDAQNGACGQSSARALLQRRLFRAHLVAAIERGDESLFDPNPEDELGPQWHTAPLSKMARLAQDACCNPILEAAVAVREMSRQGHFTWVSACRLASSFHLAPP